MNNIISQHAAEALQSLQAKLPLDLQQPAVAIICGSGLGGLADTVLPEPRAEIPYIDIPHFPRSTGIHKIIQVVLVRWHC